MSRAELSLLVALMEKDNGTTQTILAANNDIRLHVVALWLMEYDNLEAFKSILILHSDLRNNKRIRSRAVEKAEFEDDERYFIQVFGHAPQQYGQVIM